MNSRRKKVKSKAGKPKTREYTEQKRNADGVEKETGHKPYRDSKSKKIRKSCTSKEYQKTEREVQMLLAVNGVTEEDVKEIVNDPLSESVAFFCDSLAASKSHHMISPRLDGGREGDDDDEEDVREEDTCSDETISGTLPARQYANEGTYIQIEELTERLENLTMAAAAIGRRLKTEHNYCDKELLYKPGKQMPLLMPPPSHSAELQNSAIKGTLQRLYTEAQAQNTKVPNDVLNAVLQPVEYRADVRYGLYRTHCNSGDGEAHEFQPIFCASAVDGGEIPNRKLLRLFLRELRFDEHPALLDEHRLANRVDDLYEEYVQREQRKECARLEARLAVERHVMQELMLQPPNPADTTAVNRLAEQMCLVQELRNRLYDEEIESRELLQQLLSTWHQLKELRQQQQMQCTRVQLKLHIVAEGKAWSSTAARRQRWTERFECDLGEIYREQLEAYYKSKRLWRLERRTAHLPEAEKPQRPNLKRLASTLKAQLTRCMGAIPGDPKVRVLRYQDNAAHYAMPVAMSEAASLQRKSFFLKIYCDQEFVGATRTYRPGPDFRLQIHEAIGIVLHRRLPKQLRISLYEKDKLMTVKKLANILLPLNTAATAATEEDLDDDVRVQKIAFRSRKQLPLAGSLSLQYDCEEETGDTASLASLVITADAEAHQDNSDDDESERMQGEMALNGRGSTCTTEEALLQFESAGSNTMDLNARFRLLRWRQLQRNEHTPQMRFIPALAFELPDEQLNVIDGDCSANKLMLIEPGNWMDAIDVQKHDGKKRLRALYEALQGQCARMHKMLENTEQLLIGDEQPASWGLFFRTLGLIFHPNRPLTHTRPDDERLPAALLDTNSKHTIRLILMVVRGTGIPVRDFQHSTLHHEDSSSQQHSSQYASSSTAAFTASKLKYSNVRPFIVLSYKDKCCRSTTAEGSDPTWNEELTLSISGTVIELTDDVKISIYDELVEHQQLHDDDVESGLRRADIYQQRVHTNWLGDYRVPLGSLLAVPKMDGVIELRMPQVLVGYQSAILNDNISPIDVGNIEQQQYQHAYPEIRNSIYLWCYISCELGAKFSTPLRANCLECIETTEVQQQLQQWSTLVQELQPLRYHSPLVCTPEGKRVCLTRLLQPIPLPPSEVTDDLLANVCRFVSLLSVLQQPNSSTASLQGVWLNNRWLLDTGWCSAKDLGVLLCNFLLRLGLKCWLVLGVGTASTHGECTFVLYQSGNDNNSNSNNLWFIEPTTGKCFAPRDTFCPLVRVHYIVSPTNIYCNVQRELRVSMTNYNLNDTACWLPAFTGKRIVAPTGGVQHAQYTYRMLNSTQQLRQHIERKITKKITAWRTMRKTIWNRAFQPRLLVILEQLEHTAVLRNSINTDNNNINRTHSINYSKQLASEFPSYRFYGFTLNFAYTNLTAISERIKSTGLHLRNEALVEFTVAVHIHSYEQNVHSTWVFLLASVPNAIK